MMTNWQHSTVHNCTFDVIETKTLWGDISCCFSLFALDSLAQVLLSNLKSFEAPLDSGSANG
jgi:hypothetical protein